MNFILLNTITNRARFTQNGDGSIKANQVIAQIGIQGAPEGKFIQNDYVPEFNIPATKTSAEQPAYIEAKAQEYVTQNYPNT